MNAQEIHDLLRRVILILLALLAIITLGGSPQPVVATQSGAIHNLDISPAADATTQTLALTLPRLVFVTAQNLILTPDLHFLSLPFIQK